MFIFSKLEMPLLVRYYIEENLRGDYCLTMLEETNVPLITVGPEIQINVESNLLLHDDTLHFQQNDEWFPSSPDLNPLFVIYNLMVLSNLQDDYSSIPLQFQLEFSIMVEKSSEIDFTTV